MRSFVGIIVSVFAAVSFDCGVARSQVVTPTASEFGDFDPYAPTSTSIQPTAYATSVATPLATDPNWCCDFLPDGLIYRPYLAGPKESRTGIQFNRNNNEWTYDSSIGGQWGLLRIGTQNPSFPKGIQLDLEASAQLRHRSLRSFDIFSTDYRFGIPLSFSHSNHQTKFGVYFLRAHPSDRLLDTIKSLWTDDFFQRQSLVLGHAVYLSDRFRIYGEAGYAYSSEVSDKWEFQFGAECAPVYPTGLLGAPFLAANGYLREELDYGGTFTLQAGWAWRKKRGRLFRIGVQYANGASSQFSLQNWHEQQVGFGIWYDP